MRLPRPIALAAGLFVLVPGSAQPQAQDAPLKWGAEASYIGSGTLLRFTSPRQALMLGGGVVYDRIDVDESTPPFDRDREMYSVSLTAGIRFYRRVEEKTRPFFGLAGILGYVRTPDLRSWRPGAVAQFGVSHFFTRHVSLGVVSDLVVQTWREETQIGSSVYERRRLNAALNAARVIGAVYF